MSSALGLDASKNVSLFTVRIKNSPSAAFHAQTKPCPVKRSSHISRHRAQIPVVFIATCLAPHAYAVSAAGKTYDISNPRFFLPTVAKDESLDKTVRPPPL